MYEVRSEQAGDVGEIRDVNAACFKTGAEARLVDMLRDAGHLPVSLVAVLGGCVVGHVGFSPVTTDAGDIGVGLAPLAVAGSRRRNGVGGLLARSGLDACREAGFGWAVVMGDPRYYGRFGFRPATEFGLSDDYGAGPAYQALELLPGSLPAGAGFVHYAPEFASLDDRE